MTSTTIRLLFTILLTVQNGNGLKFLVYNPKFGPSHAALVGKVADELAYAGHEVVVLQQIINPNLTKPGHSHPSIRLITRDADPTIPLPDASDENKWTLQWKLTKIVSGLGQVGQMFGAYCRVQLGDEPLMARLRAEHFDLGLTEAFDTCGYGVFHKLGLRRTVTIAGSTMFLSHTADMGIPAMTSVVPDMFGVAIRGFAGRVQNLFTYWLGRTFIMPGFSEYVRREVALLDGHPDVQELLANSSFVLVNTDEFVDFPRPINHQYVNVGGYGMRRAVEKAGSLDARLAAVYERAAHGVVYVSFGSMAKSSDMPEPTKRAFVAAFKHFPQVQFVWKYENESEALAMGVPNLHTSAWLPQREILAHPRTLAFVTHGGMNSITEATFSGVPMLCIPLFAEQYRNADMIEGKGVAVQLDKERLNERDIVAALRKIVDDPGYNERAKELSRLIRGKPQTPEQRLVQACEFAARFDVQPHLAMPGRDLGPVAFYNLDAALFLITVALLLLLAAIFIVYTLLKLVLKAQKSKSE